MTAPDTPSVGRPSAFGGLQDVGLAVAVVLVLSIFFLPVPALIIDIGLVVSISLAVMILMLGLWIERPLQFSSFPTILLVATMLRLALNIATTRMILSHGAEGTTAAGHVIAGFSMLLMGGDFVIGLIIFIILTTVNFLVITKGATRIAEVGARFTLDAIPGKQMAIDADLSAGLIDEKQARARRLELEQESAFFGAMDGASKFVRGDAIAGIVILLINIVGGIILGVTRHGMSAGEAVDRYTKLSVGDGLVAQLPALIISLAAGLLVAKSGVRGSTERAIVDQFRAFPRVAFLSGGLMCALAMIPGLPFLPFALMGAGLIAVGRTAAAGLPAGAEDPDNPPPLAPPQRETPVAPAPPGLELALGKQAALALLSQRADFETRLDRLRLGVASFAGLHMGEIRLREELALPVRSYEIRFQGVRLAASQIRPGHVLVVVGEGEPPGLAGEDTREPAFGMKACWYPQELGAELSRRGFASVDVASVVLTHVGETLRNNLAQMLTFREARRLFEALDPEYRRLLDDICPAHLTWSGLQAVLKALLNERISIRNLGLVLEAVAEIVPHMRRSEQIAEHVRTRLAGQICGDLLDDGMLKVLRLGVDWEQQFHAAVRRDARGDIAEFDLEPAAIERFSTALARAVRRAMDDGHLFVILASAESRPFVRMISERLFPAVAVLSQLELARSVELKLIGSVE